MIGMTGENENPSLQLEEGAHANERAQIKGNRAGKRAENGKRAGNGAGNEKRAGNRAGRRAGKRARKRAGTRAGNKGRDRGRKKGPLVCARGAVPQDGLQVDQLDDMAADVKVVVLALLLADVKEQLKAEGGRKRRQQIHCQKQDRFGAQRCLLVTHRERGRVHGSY